MPKKPTETKQWFDATKFWDFEYSKVQKVVETICNSEGVTELILTGCRQFGKSFWVFRHLLLDIMKNEDKNYAVVIPLDTELKRFLSEQIVKPFGPNPEGRKADDIELIRIPFEKNGAWTMEPIVKKFEKSGVPSITFFNNSKLFFFAGNANPTQHIPGNVFRMAIQDEWAKFLRPINKEIQSTLIHENGTLISTTTLNEEDPTNWFATDIIRSYKEDGVKVLPSKAMQLAGLDIYKKEVTEEMELMREDGSTYKEVVVGKSVLIIGDFEKIYPFVYNGQEIYKRVQVDRKRGTISEIDYQLMYKCNPGASPMQILSNYRGEQNSLDVTGMTREEVDDLFDYQLVGYDHGNGNSTDRNCAVGWARVGVILDKENPLHIQFVIIDSGELTDEQADSGHLALFMDSFNLPVAVDPSMFWIRTTGGEPEIHNIFVHNMELRKKVFPASGDKLNNSSRSRVVYWQKGLMMSEPVDKVTKRAIEKREVFDPTTYVEYKNPINPSEYSPQILIARDKNNPELNAKLVGQVEGWKRTRNRKGEVVEPKRATIDIWDGASLGILGYLKNTAAIQSFGKSIEKKRAKTKQVKVVHTLNPKGIKLTDFTNTFTM